MLPVNIHKTPMYGSESLLKPPYILIDERSFKIGEGIVLIERDEAVEAFNLLLFKDKFEEIKKNAKVSTDDQQKFQETFSKLQSDFRRKYNRTYYDVINYLHYLSEISGAVKISAMKISLDEIGKIDKIFVECRNLVMRSEIEPVKFGALGFGFKGIIYSVTGNYTDDQIRLLILEDVEKENEKLDREREYFEKLKAKFDGSSSEDMSYDRPRIPEKVRIEVWRRDGGKCARCGSREKLEYDHIVPISKGGSNTARNIELLCERHNRSKSNNVI